MYWYKKLFHLLVACQSVIQSALHSPLLCVQYRAFVSLCHKFNNVDTVQYVSTVCSLSVSLGCSSAPGVRKTPTSTPVSPLHTGHSKHTPAPAVVSVKGAYCTCLYYRIFV